MNSTKKYPSAKNSHAVARDVALQSYGLLKEAVHDEMDFQCALEITIGRKKKKVRIPSGAVKILLDFLKATAAGKKSAISTPAKYITTQAAAEWMGCSRPHMVKLLNNGAMPFTWVGKHRRISMEDLRAFKKKQREEQKKQLILLMQADEEAGLYD
jgi:excisionase family DNA binding protein